MTTKLTDITCPACGNRLTNKNEDKTMKNTAKKNAAFKVFEAAKLTAGKYAGNVTETAQEGENARGGVEVCPEAETAPEAKETANAEAVPDSVRNYEKAAAMLEALESQVSEGESLPEHWRRVWKACGLKGVTVSSGRGGYTSSYTFKFTMMPGDLLPFENCREALEEQARERLARGVWDDLNGGYIDYFHMTGDEQRAEETRHARKYWEKVQAEGSRFSICHYWQINRKNSPEFSESFWRRWELVGRSVARLNYGHSDAMTDYFDVGFYESWEIKPEGKATYKPAEWYAVDNLYNLAKARDEKDEAERKAKEEAEAKKESEEREAAGEEFGGTIYGGSVDELRERLERLEAATDPDAVAMARGILELGETA